MERILLPVAHDLLLLCCDCTWVRSKGPTRSEGVKVETTRDRQGGKNRKQWQAHRGYITRTLGSEFPGLRNPDLETECYNPELGPSSGYITRNSVRVPGYTPGLYIEPTIRVATDASDLELGAIDLSNQTRTVHAYTDPSLHINIKEIRASTLGVQAFALKNSVVECYVDNIVTYFYLLNQGGRKRHLNKELRPFFFWAWDQNIEVRPLWVLSDQNPADRISRRGFDAKEARLSHIVFLTIVHRCRIKPVVDVFASHGNSQCHLYVSRDFDPDALACDALKTNLSGMPLLYACPPWNLIGPFLNHLSRFPKTRCLLVCPMWTGCPWWPQLLRLSHLSYRPRVVI